MNIFGKKETQATVINQEKALPMETLKEPNTCGNCGYNEMSTCYSRPPAVVMNSQGMPINIRPVVKSTDIGCGEHKQK